MAEQAAKNTSSMMSALDGLGGLPMLRQVGLMVGLAASVAIGFGVVLWSKEPNYQPLYTDVTNLEASELADLLQREKIGFKVDTNNGMVMVEADRINDARMLLAREGFPTGNAMGYELMDKEQAFGTSQFMEKTRYFRSIEGELAKTISSLTPVRNARVHLAIPKRSVFINDRRKPSASVFVELYPTRILEKTQVEAIVHLVASSVPEMSSKDVTVVDQKGHLLTETAESTEMAYAAKQLDYTHNMEQVFITRVEDLLEPLVGADKYKVQVTADIDFNVVEQTAELYNPDLPALRSEQTLNEQSSSAGPMGIPGALSNQPPGTASVPEKATGAKGNAGATDSAGNQRLQATRNYELDRTISHTRRQVGAVKRLSVAVVLDDRWVNPVQGSEPGTQPTRQSLSEAELERITLLVKDAVGFNASRGDSVSVINQPFHVNENIESIPELPIWQQPWFIEYARQGVGFLVVIVLIFGVLRPILRGLASSSKSEDSMDSLENALASAGAEGVLGGGGGYDGADVTFVGGANNPLLPGPDASFEQHIDAIKALVAEDPRRVAQVVKNWIENGG